VSGDATFAGTNYQASVIAYVFVHVLTETKLRWIALADRNDPKTAAIHLEDLFGRGVTTPDGRLTLAETLLAGH
jgi:hypothetical protein